MARSKGDGRDGRAGNGSEGGGRAPTGLTRRGFLKATALVAGTAALGGGLGGCGSLGPADGTPSGEEKVVISGCQYAGCYSCQGLVKVRDNKVVSINTWPEDPRHHKPCLRGRAHLQRIYSPDRIKYPMRRAGERGAGQWEQIGWDEAMAEIGEKWGGYIKDFGPQSIVFEGSGAKSGGYLNSYLLTRLRNIVGFTESASCDDMAMAKGLNKVFGPALNTWGFPPFDWVQLENSVAMITWSGNLTVANTQNWRGVAENRERHGMKFVVVDPNYTGTAQKADLWVRPRPGTDTVLQFALTSHIVATDRHDKDFLRDFTVAPVLVNQKTKMFLRMSDLGVAPTEGPIDPMTGQPTVIDPPVVWDNAASAPGALGAVADPPLSGSRTVNGIQTRTAWDMLLEVVDEYPPEKAAEVCDVPVETIHELADVICSGPVFHHTGYGSQSYNNGVQNGHALALLGAVTGNTGKPGAGTGSGWHGPTYNLAYTYPTGFNSMAIAKLALCFDVLETGEFKGEPFPVKSLFMSGSSIVGGFLDTNRVVRNLEKVEFIVAADLTFNDSAKYADLLLPVTHNYEQEDIFGSDLYVLYMERAVEPAFECRTDGQIAIELAKALGAGEYFEMSDDEFLHEALDSESMRAVGLTVENLKRDRCIRFLPEGYVAERQWPTGTGRMEIYVDAPFPRLDYGQEIDFDAEHMPRWFPPTEAWHEHEVMKEYPLVFMSERARNRYHTQDHEATWLREIEPEPIIRMNPADAEARGIEEGDYVEVFNARGHAVALARLSEEMRPGVVKYPKGWQIYQFKSGCWGALHNSAFDPVGVNDSYFDAVCDIRPWNEEA
ncbi:MAG: molybdopterin-dependent oxidoreductase [Coriobacteriales bacterium]|jgi:molybdopterin-containing oxidoreductase family molybdopterin binding subunit|nr:molybdopterin-dependent oxidoreductase [Coriobacteriales bacterium]